MILKSIGRSLPAIVLLALIGTVFIQLAERIPEVFGEMCAPLMRNFGLTAVGASVTKLIYCIVDANISSTELYKQVVLERSIAAGITLAARAIFMSVMLVVFCTAGRG